MISFDKGCRNQVNRYGSVPANREMHFGSTSCECDRSGRFGALVAKWQSGKDKWNSILYRPVKKTGQGQEAMREKERIKK